MALGNNVLVGQSGGPTAAINASLAGVVGAARGAGLHAIGMRYGIQGLLDGRAVDLDERLQGPAQLGLLSHTPSSYLGSCRYKLPDPAADEAPYRRLFERFGKLGARAVLYIGGNDSMDTIAKLSRYGAEAGSEIRFVGVPKTIDNDLVLTDHTPGYGSAAKFIAATVDELACDADVYDLKSVTFVEIMGRDAGWLAASASLAGEAGGHEPDLVLLPEVPLDEQGLLQRLAELIAERNTVVVAVSEGVRTADGTPVCERAGSTARLDAFGHAAALSGTSRYLADLARRELGCKARAVELCTTQRCASHLASQTDLTEAAGLGACGVNAALEGATGVMSALARVSDAPYEVRYEVVDVSRVANAVKAVPPEMIREDGMGVTEAYLRYARPLVAGEPSLSFVGGVPAHVAPLA
ncbi:MAG: 6-phosphofructokinase [Coriobacteriaceae bacterium]|uniref:6-phosphofructokinase n=1 Tax=Tractidigestivibacter sp. TaxID=2847320 RepID=UPI002A8229E4|nr:6-phosphofructokinase [Tractidigestivibacter sp.]MCI6845425.1 6-phosphofructokinase [Coriobacteriaceae bacterium]MDD7583249.1 6-phosphofructokinase [Coriobacteriaceae bacterium]MDY4533927.1 6-phosphofructokinase [Tractidigestivibacter sp.]